MYKNIEKKYKKKTNKFLKFYDNKYVLDDYFLNNLYNHKIFKPNYIKLAINFDLINMCFDNLKDILIYEKSKGQLFILDLFNYIINNLSLILDNFNKNKIDYLFNEILILDINSLLKDNSEENINNLILNKKEDLTHCFEQFLI